MSGCVLSEPVAARAIKPLFVFPSVNIARLIAGGRERARQHWLFASSESARLCEEDDLLLYALHTEAGVQPSHASLPLFLTFFSWMKVWSPRWRVHRAKAGSVRSLKWFLFTWSVWMHGRRIIMHHVKKRRLITRVGRVTLLWLNNKLFLSFLFRNLKSLNVLYKLSSLDCTNSCFL